MTEKSMAKIGLGLWKLPQDNCAEIVYQAIKLGYRLLDSACDYGNEQQVGDGIKRALDEGIVNREDLWVTSKLWNTYHAPEHVQPAIEKSLSDLGLDYLDSYLIHFPIAQPFVPFETRYPPEWITDPTAAEPKMEIAPVPLYQTWAAMEQLVEKGLTKHIGVCNYNSGLLHDLMSYANIKPHELQIESHPYLTQERLIRLAKQYGISVTTFSPLGALSYFELNMASQAESVITEPVVLAAAQAHNKTPAQIVLRWGIQRGCTIIPKSKSIHRLAENIDIFDFELSEQEMNNISALNQNKRFNDPGDFCEGAFNRFHPIYD